MGLGSLVGLFEVGLGSLVGLFEVGLGSLVGLFEVGLGSLVGFSVGLGSEVGVVVSAEVVGSSLAMGLGLISGLRDSVTASMTLPVATSRVVTVSSSGVTSTVV